MYNRLRTVERELGIYPLIEHGEVMFLNKPKKKLNKSNIALLFIVFLTGMISVYDNVMNVVFMSTLAKHEQNPTRTQLEI